MQINSDDKFWIPDQELKILQALNRFAAEYLIFGGYAMLFYGFYDRDINDLDIWISNEEENAEKVYKAFQLITDIRLQFTESDLKLPNKKIRLPSHMYEVELFTSVKGPTFSDAYSSKSVAVYNGHSLFIISSTHLLEIKTTSLYEAKERLRKETIDIAFLRKQHNKRMNSD